MRQFKILDKAGIGTDHSVDIRDSSGKSIFSLLNVTAPSSWSQLAIDIAASKFFFADPRKKLQEKSVYEMVQRVVIALTDHALRLNYIKPVDADDFRIDLVTLLLSQVAAFNSPVWFNFGVVEKFPDTRDYFMSGYRWVEAAHEACLCRGGVPSPQISACFINSVKDDLESIMELAKTEARLFKQGSGTGTDLSSLRSSKEQVSGGGNASGPCSFLKIYDAVAGGVRSGGRCLSARQPVFTERGPVPVAELVDKKFIVLSYDPPAGRVMAKWAQAWESGRKPIARITTDKGVFELSPDHPVRLASRAIVRAGDLTPGMSLHAGSIYERDDKYLCVGLRAGDKSKRLFHRLIAQDILHADSKLPVHHADGDAHNNSVDNIVSLSAGEHAKLHSCNRVAAGKHVFQLRRFGKAGAANGMARTSAFWKIKEKVRRYRAVQRKGMLGRDPAGVQLRATPVRMRNYAYQLINAGYTIDTMEQYTTARITYCGYNQRNVWRHKIKQNFGSYDAFIADVRAHNHRVIKLEMLPEQPVYDVEVLCPTPDDKTAESGHNFMLWSLDNKACVGSGIFVLNTRRAAKMNTLHVDHPDIREFVGLKVHEEEKAQALMAAGYAGGMGGAAYTTVAFQNVNLSVRVTDAFMQAVESGAPWVTIRKDGKAGPTFPAAELWDQICNAAWKCGDPGMQFADTINATHSCINDGLITSSNPCSEFVFLDNSACNLASINLIKFYDQTTREFNFELFTKVVSFMAICQDILIDNAAYPTKEIAENSHNYRPIGLGFANLGGLLMAMGLPYDSDEGRALACKIATRMTHTALKTSQAMAALLGPFARWEANKDACNAMCKRFGVDPGPLRNAQVTLMAPTGTIGLMMDCATTGIEPEMGLVRHKALAGGGEMVFVNPMIGPGLLALGYEKDKAEAAVQHAIKFGHMEGVIKPEHLPVFDCSMKAPTGTRVLSWQAHVRMLAAVQAGVTGAISKTVNMPNNCTPADIGSAFKLAHKLGCKSITVYRDGSKGGQPVTLEKKKEAKEIKPQEIKPVDKGEFAPRRKSLPRTRQSITHKFAIGGHEGYLTAGKYPDGQLGETFITMAKEGSTVGGIMDAFGTCVSVCLQYGVPLSTLVDKFTHTRFEPSGFTGDSDIPMATSILDYLFKWLDREFGKAALGKEKTVAGDTKKVLVEEHHVALDQVCGACGSIMERAGNCYKCTNCGGTSGCG